MKIKLISFVLVVLASFASAGDISWKTFDIKTGPMIGAWNYSEMVGWSLSLVKPITPYVGVGAIVEVGTYASGCEDCVDYDFNELSEGLLVNLNAPIGLGFGLVGNFMFIAHWQEGTAKGDWYVNPIPVEAFDADGNPIRAYTMEEDNSDYDFESFAFRSNLGIAWRTSGKRFGLEFYPVDFTIARGGRARYSCSLNAVARVF